MTFYEVLTASTAVVALIISSVSLIRTRRIQSKQLEYEAISAALAKKQLELLTKEEQLDERAHITAELVKVGISDYRFVIMNQGAAVASNVTFKIDPMSPDNPLLKSEAEGKLPYPSLQPGQSFTLIADFNLDSALSYDVYLEWKNPNGSIEEKKIHLTT